MPEAYTPTKKEKKQILTIQDRFEKMSRKRGDWESDWNEADKQWQMYHTTRQEDDWRSDLKLPTAMSIVEAALAEMIDQSPGIVYMPREPGDKEKAEKLQKIFEYTWEKGNGDIELVKFIKDVLIYGTGIGEEYWKQDIRAKKELEDFDLEKFQPTGWTEKEDIDFDDCYFESIPIWNFFIDPTATSLETAQDCIKRLVLSQDEFKNRYKKLPNYKKVVSGGNVFRPEWFTPVRNFDDDEVEILHYYNKVKDLYLIVANGVLLTPSDNPIPYKHKDFPFVQGIDVIVPHSFYGYGEPRVVRDLADEKDTLRNMRLDTTHLNIHKRFIVDDRLELDDEDFKARPHQAIKGPPGTIEEVQQSPIHPEAYREEELLNDDIVKATGIDPRLTAGGAGSQEETATEVAIKRESALRRVRLKLRLLEKIALRRIARLRLSNIQQFYAIPKVKTILGENEVEEEKETYRSIRFKSPSGEMTWFTSSPEDLIGEYDIVVVAGSTLPVSKALESQKKINLFDRLVGHPNVDQRKLVEIVAEAFDIDPDELLLEGEGEIPPELPPKPTPGKETRLKPEETLPGRSWAGGSPV